MSAGGMRSDEKQAVQPKCPVCRKVQAEGYRPFCSKRCADVDLGRWVSGGYVIAGSSETDESATSQASEDGQNEENKDQ